MSDWLDKFAQLSGTDSGDETEVSTNSEDMDFLDDEDAFWKVSQAPPNPFLPMPIMCQPASSGGFTVKTEPSDSSSSSISSIKTEPSDSNIKTESDGSINNTAIKQEEINSSGEVFNDTLAGLTQRTPLKSSDCCILTDSPAPPLLISPVRGQRRTHTHISPRNKRSLSHVRHLVLSKEDGPDPYPHPSEQDPFDTAFLDDTPLSDTRHFYDTPTKRKRHGPRLLSLAKRRRTAPSATATSTSATVSSTTADVKPKFRLPRPFVTTHNAPIVIDSSSSEDESDIVRRLAPLPLDPQRTMLDLPDLYETPARRPPPPINYGLPPPSRPTSMILTGPSTAAERIPLIDQCLSCKKRYKNGTPLCKCKTATTTPCTHEYTKPNCMSCMNKLNHKPKMKFRPPPDQVDRVQLEIDTMCRRLDDYQTRHEEYQQQKVAMKTYNCELCAVTCYNDKYFSAHMAGRRHANNVAKSRGEPLHSTPKKHKQPTPKKRPDTTSTSPPPPPPQPKPKVKKVKVPVDSTPQPGRHFCIECQEHIKDRFYKGHFGGRKHRLGARLVKIAGLTKTHISPPPSRPTPAPAAVPRPPPQPPLPSMTPQAATSRRHEPRASTSAASSQSQPAKELVDPPPIAGKKFCHPCQKHIAKSNFSHHVKNQSHLDNVNHKSYECLVCSTGFSSKKTLRMHLNSKKHKKRQEEHPLDIPDPHHSSSDPDDPEYEGANVRQSKRFFATFSTAEAKYKICTTTFTYYCAVCDKIYHSGAAYRAHCLLKSHKVLYRAYTNYPLILRTHVVSYSSVFLHQSRTFHS